MTYFEETWVAEKEHRRHSIEREIEIKESEFYNKNKPPPLFYGRFGIANATKTRPCNTVFVLISAYAPISTHPGCFQKTFA